MRVANLLRLVAPGTPPTQEAQYDIVLARGAFGSGEHETTRACLEALESLDRLGGAHVLDLGCGTGVLAIAAVALGARSALAVDIDAGAVAVARTNCSHNGVLDRVAVAEGTVADVPASDEFDVVVANLPAAVLIADSPGLIARAAPRATLVLSGILWEEACDVEERYGKLGCSVIRRRMLEEYVLLVMRTGERPAPTAGIGPLRS